MKSSFIFSSESVTEGHPDKIADQISDSVLDACFRKDKYSRVACETMIAGTVVMVSGEVTTEAHLDIPQIVRSTTQNIGYDSLDKGFDYRGCSVLVALNQQSPDISQGVGTRSKGIQKEQGAGDQGLVFGYATDETENFMPLPINLAHSLTKALTTARKSGNISYLRPDGKSQVAVRYEDNVPVAVTSVVISAQHDENISQSRIREDLIEKIGKAVIPEHLLSDATEWHINPTGRFVIGGPYGDCGLTGRKIIVDTYGGMGRHGGGCFSGKDPSKVDRSAAYAARYVAKNIVAAGIAKECELQLAYAIGYPKPVSINVNTFGTCQVDEQKLIEFITDTYPFSPYWIIEQLQLLEISYLPTATYGHFGRELPGFTWEKTDLVEEMRGALR